MVDNSPPTCTVCGTAAEIPRRCNYCDALVCESHALPEQHDCPALTLSGTESKHFESDAPSTLSSSDDSGSADKPRKHTHRVNNAPPDRGDDESSKQPQATRSTASTLSPQTPQTSTQAPNTSLAARAYNRLVQAVGSVFSKLSSTTRNVLKLLWRLTTDGLRLVGVALTYLGGAWLLWIIATTWASTSISAVVPALAGQLLPVVLLLAGVALVALTTR